MLLCMLQQQHSVGVADGILTTGVDGTTQPVSGAASIMTPMCDPRALMGEAVLDRLVQFVCC